MKSRVFKVLVLTIVACLFIFQTSAFAIVSPSDKFSDMNADGKISSVDALIILQAASKTITLTPELMDLGDVNDDGKVTPLDALMLLHSIRVTI